MKRIAVLLGVVMGFSCGWTQAQEAVQAARQMRSYTEGLGTGERTPRDLFQIDGSYVFSSRLENGTGYGDQDALQTSLEYSHRFLLTGKIFLRAGVAYDRFDFGSTFAPVPEQLHSLAGVVALEYMVGPDVGAFIQFRPGYYAETDFDSSSFDVPITLGRAFVLQPDRLYLFVGATAAFLRSEFPVLPIGGIIWRPNEQWTFFGMLPEPRLTYSPSQNVSFWVGGQLVGGSFRVDRNSDIVPQRLSGARLNYTDLRAGLGVEFRVADTMTLNIGGGYSFQRRFDFAAADVDFDTEPAPYVRASLKAEF